MTGVQTCALPICQDAGRSRREDLHRTPGRSAPVHESRLPRSLEAGSVTLYPAIPGRPGLGSTRISNRFGLTSSWRGDWHQAYPSGLRTRRQQCSGPRLGGGIRRAPLQSFRESRFAAFCQCTTRRFPRRHSARGSRRSGARRTPPKRTYTRGSEVLKTIEGASRNHAELMAAAGLGPTKKGTYV